MENLPVANQISGFFADQPFDEDLIFYKHQKYPVTQFENQMDKEENFYFISDFHDGKIPYRSEGWKSLLDYPQNFWDQGITALWQIVHPEDIMGLSLILTKWLDFVKAFETEELLNKYSVNFTYRIVQKTGKSIHVLQQNIYTSLDNKGNVIYTYCRMTNIAHLQKKEDVSLQIFGHNGEKIYEYFPHKFTKRRDPALLSKSQNVNNKNKFIDQVQNIIRQNLDDELFGVQNLSEALHLSRTQVYRKVLSNTNLSPNALIKLTRLGESARLLQENYYNVTEIAYKVGFSNPAYFIKNFKKLYSQTPKEYQRKHISTDFIGYARYMLV
jgi:AraC-like DNA-binding protein